jgi:hypothetical protein
MTAGYSGTPLLHKLGITNSTRLFVIGEAEQDYAALIGELPAGAKRLASFAPCATLVHIFAREREALAAELKKLRTDLNAEATIWVSWPKKSSKQPSTISEDTIRELALPLGFVDIKVCAVSDVWSGLKLVVRKALRPKSLR